MIQHYAFPRVQVPGAIPSPSSSSQLPPGTPLRFQPFIYTDTLNSGVRLSPRPHSMAPCYPSCEDATVAICDRSTLRRRPHIRRAPGSPNSPKSRVNVGPRGPRRVSAPASVPGEAGPSTSRIQDDIYRASLISSPPVHSPPKPKPRLHPIVTSDLAAIPKMRVGVQNVPAPDTTPRPTSSRKLAVVSTHSSLPASRTQKPTHSNVAVAVAVNRTNNTRRPLPSAPTGVTSTIITVGQPTTQTISGSTSSRKPSKKSTNDTDLSAYISPATIWSQQSAPLSGIPPSRRTSLFITCAESRPPSTIIGADIQRKTTLDKLLVDWSRVDQMMQETVILSRHPTILRSGSGPGSKSGSRSSDDTTTTAKEDIEHERYDGDNASPASSSTTPTTAGLPTPTYEANKHALPSSSVASPMAKQGGPVPSSSSAVVRKPRYEGPWGRAAAPSESGNGTTVGDLLMERWARAHSAISASAAGAGQTYIPHATGVAVQ